ncbi:MAG: hypothetical protein A2W35_19315 [Chloroflexi bacterium RBG_16_57_11]|nr:MAG: hypothetical protein A2W35_19315 [Chloroflexi bacterium RBG_16_57_11]
MGAHIFLVSEDNFDICLKHGIYGCVEPSKEWNKAEIIAGLLSIKKGDLIFFYVKNMGVFGLWILTDEPFLDKTRIWANDNQIFPYRFIFEPVVGDFPKPISLSDVLDLHDKGKIWTFDLNPVQQKNQYKITTGEAKEFIRLLLRNNPVRKTIKPISDPYIPLSRDQLEIQLDSRNGRQVNYEGWLNAWFMKSFRDGELIDLFGDYYEYLNLVPTSFNKVMDIFLTHVTTVNGIEILHKYTCIELKTATASEKDLSQILRYEDWLARKLAGGDKDMIQSVLIANQFTDTLIDYLWRRHEIEEKTVRLITYQFDKEDKCIRLNEMQPMI